jgi:thiamine kinase-like enzyme
VPNETTCNELRIASSHHPAILAWARLQQRPVETTEVAVLKKRFKSAIYRIGGIAPGSSSIAAKYCQKEVAAHERVVYEQILRDLPVSSPRYYGFVHGDSNYDWLFLEYVEGEQYSRQRADHSILAGKWLGLLHTLGARVAAAARLPARGPAYYQEHLHTTCEKLQRNLKHLHLPANELATVKGVISQCNFLESHWGQIERWCDRMPSTLLHGDFKPRNVIIRTINGLPTLLPFDWEVSGWGVPAEDLAYVDLAAYHAVVQYHWPSVTMRDLHCMKIVGRIFRGLSEFRWESVKFEPDWDFSAIKLDIYQLRMKEAIDMAEWEE